MLGAPLDDLRVLLRNDFFGRHIDSYSRSRRKAPIYWQLSIRSGRYSVWLYYHCLNKDTFYRVLNDYVSPALLHAERKLSGLLQGTGGSPNSSERDEIAEQGQLVEELRGFRDEVARVAPLWNPDLNDGVIVNFAPLWRLVPQHRTWQKECKECWDKLVLGDYDWSHLAMQLWPQRVVAKCADDRSLAIAHGLDALFWIERSDGKWQKRSVDQASIDRLIADRTSPAVRDALNSMLDAPAPSTGRGSGRRLGSARRAAAAERISGADGAGRDFTDDVHKAIVAAINGVSKAEVLAMTGITDGQWNAAIKALLSQELVAMTGERRGARYHIVKTRGRP
jgi:hypothetical protein